MLLPQALSHAPVERTRGRRGAYRTDSGAARVFDVTQRFWYSLAARTLRRTRRGTTGEDVSDDGPDEADAPGDSHEDRSRLGPRLQDHGRPFRPRAHRHD